MSQRRNISDKQPILMKIGQLAKESNTNKSTIHHYINLGLLPPPFKKHARLHFFNNTHLTRLKLIQALRKEKKISLPKIKEAFDNGELQDMHPEIEVDTDDTAKYLDFKRYASRELHDKRALILDAAIELFSQNVFGSVRMDDIAEKAEIPKATIYQYFSSKHELFVFCIERLNDTMIIPVQQIEEIVQQTDFYKRFHKRIAAFLINYPSFRNVLTLSRMMLGNEDPELRNKAKQAFQLIARAPLNDVLEAQEKGTVRKINPEIVSYILCGMADIIGQRLEIDSQFNVEEVTDIYIDFIRNGLFPKKEQPAKTVTPEQISVELVLDTGTRTQVKNIRFDGKEYLPAKLEDATVKVEVHRLSALTINPTSLGCAGTVTLKTGEKMSLDLEPDTIITGEMIVGNFEIQICKISKIFFD